MSDNEKPPIGLIPRSIHDQKRALEILEAMQRYVRSHKAVPKEWIEELSQLY